jgi:hypothetical protein
MSSTDGPRRLSHTSPTHPTHGQVGVPGAREVLVEGVVEVEQPLVAALHDQRRSERLGDRADAELRIRRGQRARVGGVAGARGAVPHRFTVAYGGARQAWRLPLDLMLGQSQVQTTVQFHRQRPGGHPGGQDIGRPART